MFLFSKFLLQRKPLIAPLSKCLSSTEVFESIPAKNQDGFHEAIQNFKKSNKEPNHYIDFIYAALNNMDKFKVSRKLEAYKSLIEILPKGKYLPENIIQAEFMHYPRQQECILDVLEQMELNGVIPDKETGVILREVFGQYGFPLRKYHRMLYWMPKFQKISPWPLPNELPDNELDLAKLALNRVSNVDGKSKITEYKVVEIGKDKTSWIVSSQSCLQKKLLNGYNENVYITGPHRTRLREKVVEYFILKGVPNKDVKGPSYPFKDDPEGSVHVQEDGTIFATCSIGNPTKESLLSWVKLLEQDGNPRLETTEILFVVWMKI
ncbi:unnamed protein product [Brassicogethes aeneus]|uniref:Evolutionarily conserved signaling intermediate in Toll pathway, mitochondrial n=1 Tax=Brassicogethes aeneus TaxID=1431903 RepID=A0A9P0B5D7_BRAAE|nr:unnamed protein product [Brassicogethes aeneus]